MNFNLKLAFVATIFVTTSISAVIERKGTQNNLPVIQLEEPNADGLSVRAQSRFKFCRNINFDDCTVFPDIQPNICYNLPANWNNVCSSAQALDGNRCIIYTETNCKGRYAGYVTGDNRFADLRNWDMDDESSSFSC